MRGKLYTMLKFENVNRKPIICLGSSAIDNKTRYEKPYCHATLKQYSSRCSFLAPFSSNLDFFYPHNLFLVACRSKSVLVVLELLDGSAVLRNVVMSPWIFSSGKVVYHTPGKSARLLSTMIKRAALSSGKVKLAEPPTALRTLVMSRHRLQEDTSAGVIRPLGECSYKHN